MRSGSDSIPDAEPACAGSSSQTVAKLFDSYFRGKKLILVSNREPYVHQRTRGTEKVKEPIGGLTRALDPVMKSLGGTWIAWGSGNADQEHSDDRGRERVPPFFPSYTLRRVWLSRDEVSSYYYGFSNQVLWPLFHYMTDKVRLQRKFWRGYQSVNSKFSAAVSDELESAGGVVWLQDYHLALGPREVRKAFPKAVLTQFWHIPWVSPDVLRVIPQAEDLLDGLLANDMLTFHTPQFASNFLDACDQLIDCKVDYERGVVESGGRSCHVNSVPISIDFSDFNDYASSERAAGSTSDSSRSSISRAARLP